MSISNHFSTLFRRYRLRSEIESLHELADALAERRLYYEPSIFSHWQRGSRIPKDRPLLLALIQLFLSKQGMETIQEANDFMASAEHGYLTWDEIDTLPFKSKALVPFQVPRIPKKIIRRDEYVTRARQILDSGTGLCITGLPGVGKSTFVTTLAHEVQDSYKDGVIWIDVTGKNLNSVISQVLLAYGQTYPLDADEATAIQLYRSLLASKNVLIIFENVIDPQLIVEILPNSTKSSFIVSSHSPFRILQNHADQIQILPFSEIEAKEYYKLHFTKSELTRHIKQFQLAYEMSGGLPFALALYMSMIKKNNGRIIFPNSTKQSFFANVVEHLESSIHQVYNNLTPSEKKLLTLFQLFDRSQISFQFLYAASGFTKAKTEECLITLIDSSLVTETEKDHFVLHQVVEQFLFDKAISYDVSDLKRLALAYTSWLKKVEYSPSFYQQCHLEYLSIIKTIENCLNFELYSVSFLLWEAFGNYYWHASRWEDFAAISAKIQQKASHMNDYTALLRITLMEMSRLYYYDGKISQAYNRGIEALKLASNIQSDFYTALANERVGKICLVNDNLLQGVEYLNLSISLSEKINETELVSHAKRYLSEYYFHINKLSKAKQLLEEADAAIKLCQNPTRITIYQAVIQSHLGFISLKEHNYKRAVKFFDSALESEATNTVVRGTYMWLNSLGKGIALRLLGYIQEADLQFCETKKIMKQLGIIQNFKTINLYALFAYNYLEENNLLLKITNN